MSPPLTIDAVSLLVEVGSDHRLDALETELAARGFTLGVALADAGSDIAVGDWLAKGAPGATSAFADPADHLLAGLEATLLSGDKLEVRAGPRRAVGPDLTALFVGAHSRFGSIDRAWLRIHRLHARRPRSRCRQATSTLPSPRPRHGCSTPFDRSLTVVHKRINYCLVRQPSPPRGAP